MSSVQLWEPHLSDLMNQYSQNFYWTATDFLSSKQVACLLEYAQQLELEGALSPAAIGKGVRKKRVSEVRSDKVYWLDDFSSNAGEIVKSIFYGLQEVVRKEFYLPAKRFECHFAKYEKGSRYKRHKDRHIDLPGRLVTCVVYLTKCQGTSGNLVLYDESQGPIQIQPQPGRIVVFDSALEHEVIVSHADRWSVTGWVREDLHPGLRI